MRQVLSDVRVVEVGNGFAAGWCGKVFADLGADVVKVEPPEGDELRSDRGLFAHLNTNKRSAVVEVAPAASTSLVALLDGADLVIETPGMRSLADWGIARDDLVSGRTGDVGGRDHRVRRVGPVRRVRVERRRRAGVQRRARDGPAGPRQVADVARRGRGRSRGSARRVGRGPARPLRPVSPPSSTARRSRCSARRRVGSRATSGGSTRTAARWRLPPRPPAATPCSRSAPSRARTATSR